jgi:hypothetical protein
MNNRQEDRIMDKTDAANFVGTYCVDKYSDTYIPPIQQHAR